MATRARTASRASATRAARRRTAPSTTRSTSPSRETARPTSRPRTRSPAATRIRARRSATTSSGNSSVDLCNTDGEATRCAQDNAVGIVQLGDGNDAQVEAHNQIAGRDAYEGQARGGNVSGDSSADIETGDSEGEGQVPGGWPTGPPVPGEPQTPGGWPTGPPEPPPDDGGPEPSGGVCNGNRPATDCTQSNAVEVAQGSGKEAQVVAANQIAGRDAYEGTAQGDTSSGDSVADVCSGGAATGCAQEHAVTAVEGRLRAIDQIAGRFARGGSALVLRPHRA